MANPNNLTSTNVSGNTENPTDFFFNNFFQPAFTVSQNVDDAVIGYFEKITDDKESARILASAVIYTSLARNIDPMETLTKFSSMDASDLNSYVPATWESTIHKKSASTYKEQYYHEQVCTRQVPNKKH